MNAFLQSSCSVYGASQYDLYHTALEEIKVEGGLKGQAHFSWTGTQMERGFPWMVTTELFDFVELLQFRYLNRLGYYHYLNLGFHLTAVDR